jgi:hypothetical protein
MSKIDNIREKNLKMEEHAGTGGARNIDRTSLDPCA